MTTMAIHGARIIPPPSEGLRPPADNDNRVVSSVEEWQIKLPHILGEKPPAWTPLQTLFHSVPDHYASLCRLTPVAAANLFLESDKASAKILADAGVPIFALGFRELDVNIPVILNLRGLRINKGLPISCSEDGGKLNHLVGCLWSGEVHSSGQIPVLYERLVARRAALLTKHRQATAGKYAGEVPVSPIEDREAHNLHQTTTLVGLLNNVSPPETDYRIYLASGNLGKLGLPQVAVSSQTSSHTEIVLPPITAYEIFVHDKDEDGTLRTATSHYERVKRELLKLGKDSHTSMEVSLRDFLVGHRYEGRHFMTPVIVVPNELLKETAAIISAVYFPDDI